MVDVAVACKRLRISAVSGESLGVVSALAETWPLRAVGRT